MTNNRRFALSLIISCLSLTVFAHQGCQGPSSTSTGNPLTGGGAVDLKIAAFSGTSTGGNSISVMKMCFKRLRFKAAPGSQDTGNITLDVGEVDVTTSGADLNSVAIPEGDYSRVEFDLDDSCGTGLSLSVTNNAGTFTTTDNMTIRFDGNLTVSGTQTVQLLIQQIADSLAAVTNSSDLKTAAESMSGDCSD